MHFILEFGLLALGAFLLGSSWAVAVDRGGLGSRITRFSASLHAVFGNRYWLGRERGLRRFYAVILALIGIGAIVGGLERVFGFGPG